jgi:hypothetical protein
MLITICLFDTVTSLKNKLFLKTINNNFFIVIIYKMIIILILIIILIFFYINQCNFYEDFMVYWSGDLVQPIVGVQKYPNYPFWNSRIGQTSNMSYDLRGDPLTIPKYPYMWNYSTLTPIHNKSLN